MDLASRQDVVIIARNGRFSWEDVRALLKALEKTAAKTPQPS